MFASINLLIFGSMKTKRTVFEVNDVYRVMENSELIYTLTNSEKLKREEYKYEQMEIEGLCLSDVLETLTPSRKKVAYAAIELYKRLKEGQVESPALLSSNNVYKMMHPVLCDIATEEMWVLLLNSSSKLIRKVRISCGGYRREPHSRRDESRRTRTAYGEISYSQRRERATAPVIKPTTHGNIFRSQPQEIPHVRPLR